jgi:hypothetical protein
MKIQYSLIKSKDWNSGLKKVTSFEENPTDNGFYEGGIYTDYQYQSCPDLTRFNAHMALGTLSLEPRYGSHSESARPEKSRMNIKKDGRKGRWRKGIPTSSGVWSPFLELQRLQAVARLSQVVFPPRDLGIT